jgi:hypothetical protein
MADNHSNTPEVWKAIPDFPGYEVSNQGRVRSFWAPVSGLKRRGNRMFIQDTPQKILSQYIDRDGYFKTSMRQNHVNKSIGVHRIVLLSFIGKCPEGNQCRHLDGNRANNNITNLTWGTAKQNQNDRFLHGRGHKITCPKGEAQWLSKIKSAEIHEIRYLRKNGYLLREIGKLYGISESNVSMIVNNITWQHI